MYKSIVATLYIFVITAFSGFSQKYVLTGKVMDRLSNESLMDAHVQARALNDTLTAFQAITENDGSFQFNLDKGEYMVTVSFIGYRKFSGTIEVLFKEQSMGNVFLSPENETIGEVNITGKAPQAIINGDTIEYVASAFKVNPDANVEDMVKKMPGVTVENGTVKAQGEDIKKVLVDGKAFFGDDPSIALKNLPAELVDRIQIFDEQSEQSQFTGFNDGQTTKTMNIVTRGDRRNGSFGKGTVAYGDQERYIAGVNYNKFDNDKRISLIASSNNVNQQNFATQDFLGARNNQRGSRESRRGSFNGGFNGNNDNNGLSTINSVGLNFSNTYGKKINYSGSYFFNNNNDVIFQRSNTENILSNDSSRMEYSTMVSNSKNYNNRMNLRFEWDIDSMNSLNIIPSINFQTNHSESDVTESQAFLVDDQHISTYSSQSNDNRETNGYSISNRTTFRHKFAKNGRTFSIDQNTRLNKNDPYSTSVSNIDYVSSLTNRITDRITATQSNGYTLSANLAYTEPLGKISQVQVNYRNSYSKSYSYRKTSDLDSLLNTYLQIDTLSNKYLNNYLTTSMGLAYLVRTKKLTANAGIEFQHAYLRGEQTYPQAAETNKPFFNALPNFQLRYRVAQQRTLVVNYNTSTNAPSVSQLQNVAEYSANLTKVTIGNPDLEPEYRHSISSRLIYVNRETGSNFFFLAGSTISQNSIGNSTIYYDTIQVTMPINKGTAYSLRSMANVGFRISPLKSNMNLSSGYTFNNSPGFVNGKANIAMTNTFTQSLVFSSNISEKIDFTLSTHASYSFVNNSVAMGNDDNYYSQNSSFKLNWILWKNFTFQNDITNRFYHGLSSGYNIKSTVINLGVGKKFLKNNAGELKFTAYDLLNNNSNVSRNITANQITDQEITTLNRYFLASFTYTFRNFKQGEEPNFRGRPDGMGRPQFERD